MTRITLTCDLNLWCDINNTTGVADDNNDGSYIAPVKNLFAAVKLAMYAYDANGHNMFINLRPTTSDNPYQGFMIAGTPVGACQFYIQGATAQNGLPATSFPVAGTIEAVDNAICTVSGLQMLGGNGVVPIKANRSGCVDIGSLMRFESADAHMCSYSYGRIYVLAPYTIAGSATQHMQANMGGIIGITGITGINIPNNISFNMGMFAFQGGQINCYGTTFTGGGVVTGSRGQVQTGGVINTGGNVNLFPGTSPITNVNGGFIL